MSNIFEKLMHSDFWLRGNLPSAFLCGYRNGYNLQHALVAMLEKWRISLDKGRYGGGIIMDLSKVFDTLDHGLLIAKLHSYGFDKKKSP